MTHRYDIIVIGAGSAGLSTALFTGKTGLRTLLIDKSEQHIGGDCLNWGCVPSKALIHVARIVHSAKEASRFGLNVSGKPDIAKVMDYVRSTQATIREHENKEFLTRQGIDVVIGEASFLDGNSVQVNGTAYHGRKIVIATGSRPVQPKIPGIELVTWFDNESLFDVTRLPERIIVLGAGPVGVEVAQALRRLSCEVILVGRNKQILPGDPKEITDILHKELTDEGIIIHTSTEIERFVTNRTCTLKNEHGTETPLDFDAVFFATGRAINFQTLHPERAGVEMENGFIKNDARLATTNPHIYVCGDVAGRRMFSHAAEQHARVLLNNFFSPLKKRVNNDEMSWVTFSDPQVATFGRSELQLREDKTPYEKIAFDFADDDRAVVDDYRFGKLLLLVSRKNVRGRQRILGGCMVAPQAGEMVQELILAMRESLDIRVLFDKLYPYPVASRVNQLAVVQHQEQRLTPNIKRLLRFMFRI